MFRTNNRFQHARNFLIRVLSSHFFRFVPDALFLKIKYYLVFSSRLDLKAPKTFNEKIQWLKLHDRKTEYTLMADKYEARKYIKEKTGDEYLVPLLGVWNKFDDIDFDTLPDKFVLKVNHLSGRVFICKDKNSFNKNKVRKIINQLLKSNYYHSGREYPYKNIVPLIIAEEYLTDNYIAVPNDYKFMCFNGEPKCLFICSKRFSKNGVKITFYDIDWHIMPFIRKYPRSEIELEKPHTYNKMLELSRKLSSGLTFLRVDFYEIDKKLYIGELTFYPGGGFEEFIPLEWDSILGSWMSLK